VITFKEARELLYDAWGIAFVIWSGITFHMIATVGYARFYEHNSWILWTEIGILGLFGILAIERTVEDFIRMLREHGKL